MKRLLLRGSSSRCRPRSATELSFSSICLRNCRGGLSPATQVCKQKRVFTQRQPQCSCWDQIQVVPAFLEGVIPPPSRRRFGGNGTSLTDFLVNCGRWLRLAHVATEASWNRRGHETLTSHNAVKTRNHSGVHGDDKGNVSVLTRQRVAAVIAPQPQLLQTVAISISMPRGTVEVFLRR